MLYTILLIVLILFVFLYFKTKYKLEKNIKNFYFILDNLPHIIVIHDMNKIYYLSPSYKNIINKEIKKIEDYLSIFSENEKAEIIKILSDEKKGVYKNGYRTINNREFYIISKPIIYNGKKVSMKIFNDITDIIEKDTELNNMNNVNEIINQLLNLTYSSEYNLIGTVEIIYNYLRKLNFIDLFSFAEIKNDIANINIYYKNKKMTYTSSKNDKILIWYIYNNNIKKLYIEDIFKFNKYKTILNLGSEIKELTSYIFSFKFENEISCIFFSKIGNDAYSNRDKKIIELLASQINFILRYQYVLHKYNIDKEYFKNIANKDPLTKLYSRFFFNEWILKHSEYLKRKNKKSIFVMIDINKFKNINDTYGHLVGDEVLKFVGNRILENIRAMDIAVRFGGDEFLLVFLDTNIEDINKKMKILCKEIKKNKFDFDLDISYGISEFNGENYVEALKIADENMYKMKNIKNGNNN
ncbi:GGDEF domain-containing protein [Marinitoga sp. 38H-ov]|uniref:GGDEF domain-containing protein n=1 Tax=Marinitoga sp. 38H-ov TaxID=1755814 RepID=UPI0013ED4E81|nr:GGDEF domain-containing protein [Marinitoga sp. 38H-ov]KAF2957086.1 hypothetical protein AS160_00060 [Marinitoga sp. 38H-ov]